MSQDLGKQAADSGIRYFLISFVDLFGVLRAKLVPAAAIGQMQRDGAAFAGFSTHLDLTPADPDMFAMPDPASLIQVPWKRSSVGSPPTCTSTASRSSMLPAMC
jgi:glutamine synthetase